MSTFCFGYGTGEVSDETAEAIRQALDEADEGDVEFFSPRMPEGPRYWFACPNLGEPFDRATANRVKRLLADKGIELPS